MRASRIYLISAILLTTLALISFEFYKRSHDRELAPKLPNHYATELAIVEGQHGLPNLLNFGGSLISTNLVSWAEGWSWDGATTQKHSKNEYRLSFAEQSQNAVIRISPGENRIDYLVKFTSDSQKSTTGIAFDFVFDGNASSSPIINETMDGWTLPLSQSKEITFKISPRPADIRYERGNKHHIRVWVIREKTELDKTYRFSLTNPAYAYISYDDQESKLAELDRKYKLSVVSEPTRLDPLVNLASLNHKPAGKFGFIKTTKSQFTLPSGEPIKFWGVNIQAESLFIKDKQLIKDQAQKLARMGVNLARLHHHDSASWVRGSLIADGPTTQELNKDALDSYHWWIKCLKDEGIYLWIDLQVGRPWREGDQLKGWNSDFLVNNGMADGKGFVYVNRRMQNLTRAFNEALLLTKNPYTGKNLVEEPAVMGVQILNENDLTAHFGFKLINEGVAPYHRSLLRELAESKSTKLKASSESLMQLWRPGSSREFISEVEADFFRDMISHLREIGLKVPISTTNLWGRDVYLHSLPSLAEGDFIDAHTYATENPLIQNLEEEPNFLSKLAFAQLDNKPFTISEYNAEDAYVSALSHIIVPYTSSVASFQDWGAIVLYGYSQDRFLDFALSSWSSHKNPAVNTLAAASSLLFRQQQIQPSSHLSVLRPKPKVIFDPKRSKAAAQKLVADLHHRRISTQLTGLKQSDTLLETKNFEPSVFAKQLQTELSEGSLQINSPKVQGVINSESNNSIVLGDLELISRTSHATILINSADSKPIANSNRILLTTQGQLKRRKLDNKEQILTSPVSASITLRSSNDDLMMEYYVGDSLVRTKLNVTERGSEYIYNINLSGTSTSGIYRLIGQAESGPLL